MTAINIKEIEYKLNISDLSDASDIYKLKVVSWKIIGTSKINKLIFVENKNGNIEIITDTQFIVVQKEQINHLKTFIGMLEAERE
jgi:hypothetical protein